MVTVLTVNMITSLKAGTTLGLIGFVGVSFNSVRQKKLFLWPVKLEADPFYKRTGQGLSPGSYTAEIPRGVAGYPRQVTPLIYNE